MKKIIFIYVLSFVFLSSCSRESYLDFQPRGVIVPSTITDYRLLLDQVATVDGGLSFGFGRTHVLNVYVSDNQKLNTDIINSFGLEVINSRAYLLQENFFSSTDNDADWDTYYNQIYVANIVLEGLNTITEGTAQEKNALQAEAKLHSAFAYFNLVNLYGLHYNPATADNDLGVPIRTGIALQGLDLTRASVQQIYDFILQNINESLDDLKDAQDVNLTFRPSKAGAYGLLAKVKLYQGKYQEALDAAALALEFNNILRDLNADETDQFTGVLNAPTVTSDEQIIWFKFYGGDMFPSDELIELYEEKDLRNKWYATVRALFGDDVDDLSYQAGSTPANTSDGITTPDMYLVRAECNARLGNIVAANADLNTLREKRYETGTYTPLNITDQVSLLGAVKEERRREMVNSTQRTFDIKRYNLFDNDNISITHTLNGQTATLEANSKNWAFPIAPKYIQQNPEIVQNPRD